MSKLDEKWPSYAQVNVLVPKWHLAYFVLILDFGLKFFLEALFKLILNVSDKFIEKCRRSRLFGEWHLGKMGFWDMAILVTFWSIFEDTMANLGLIDFKIGLYIKMNVNAGQNKFEVHI